jgi:nitrosocyanin
VRIDPHKQDIVFLILILLIIFGLPFAIRAYDEQLKPHRLHSDAKEFTLTGNTRQGWLVGEVQAFDILSVGHHNDSSENPVITVNKDDLVVLKLRSSDVTHGFSLKAFGIYIAEGIHPGRTVYVSFKADKIGTFTFRCNVFCGDIHQHMQGTLIVKDKISG